MLTEKDYCDYDTCVALKELGYKESCFGHYFNAEFYIDMPPKYYQSDRYVSAPTLYETQKWLREEKKIEVVVFSRSMIGAPYYFQVYTEDYVIADDKDYASENRLIWFIDEQVEEEESARDMIFKFEAVEGNKYGMYMLDKELAARVYNTPSPLAAE